MLTHLHLAGPSTRSELCEATGLTRSSVAALVGDLDEAGLVTETPTSSDGRPGRPSPRVGFADGRAVLAMEVLVDSVAAAWVSLGGQLLSVDRLDRPRTRISVEDTIEDLVDLVIEGWETAGRPRLFAVGVAVSGLARRDTGEIVVAPNLGWKQVPVRRLLREHERLRSVIGSMDDVAIDVQSAGDSACLAEVRRGVARGHDDVIFVTAEVGLGGGLVSAGRLLRGAAGHGGEVSHMVVNPNGRLCACGATGCWETEVGERALLLSAGLDPAGGRAEVEVLLKRAADGDRAALTAFAEAGRWLALGLANLSLVTNPQLLVLGGIYQRGFAYVEQVILREFRSRPLAPVRELKLVASTLEANGSLVGASELAFDRVLTDPLGYAGALAG
ncbi:MAG: ROK family transcriptional regulator [Actinomycetota bacterium]